MAENAKERGGLWVMNDHPLIVREGLRLKRCVNLTFVKPNEVKWNDYIKRTRSRV